MKRLDVLFDGDCAMCVRCRDWLLRQRAYVPLRFVPLQSPDLARLFPGIAALKPGEQLLVIGDNGAVYRGAAAWVMCLWALEKYRMCAWRLSEPILLPFARVVCELLSRNRFFISRAFLRDEDQLLPERLSAHVAPSARPRANVGTMG